MRRVSPLGFWIPDGPSSDRITSADLPGRPHYNEKPAMACVAACKRRGTAIDGGAYIGTFSTHIVPHFKRVIAFEPLKENFDCLVLNVPTVECHHAALSDKTEMRSIGQPAEGRKTYQWTIGEQINATPVQGQAIDDLGLTDVNLIKLDVESHEFEVLQGAIKTIKLCRPVIMIEEKLDKRKRASKMLQDLGMVQKGQWKHDMLFVWR